MGKPPGSDDERRDEAKVEAAKVDPDRAAILARRQRFIALALSGLATAACDKPNDDSTTPKDGKAVQGGKDDGETPPQPCLNVTRVPDEDAGDGSTGKPMPCLEVMPSDPPPGSDDGAPPQPCLKVAAPPPEPEPKPQPCLKVAAPPPEPEPKPQPCLKVAPPPEEPKPQPCLRVAPAPKGPKPMPRPCLNVAPRREPEPGDE